MLINLETNEYPVSEYYVIAQYPNTSFPRDFSNIDWTQFGYAYVHGVAKPAYDIKTQGINEVLPQADQSGVYFQTWQVYQLDSVTMELAELRNTESLAYNARALRSRLLAASDWTQVADSPLTAESRAAWAAYRQALRDITQQATFPQEIIWPTQPQ